MTIASDALREVNKVRERFDLEPLPDLPKGRRKQSTACPIAKALAECGVGGLNKTAVWFSREDDAERSGWATWSGEFAVLPAPIERFVRSFDNGRQKRYERK
jgi:hypothetical protein